MGVLAVLILPLLVVGISGIVYIYRTVTHLMSKSAVRSKVVVITDALSGVGKGKQVQQMTNSLLCHTHTLIEIWVAVIALCHPVLWHVHLEEHSES